MFGDADQDLVEIGFRVKAVQFGCADQRIDGGGPLAAGVRAAENIILPSKRDRPQKLGASGQLGSRTKSGGYLQHRRELPQTWPAGPRIPGRSPAGARQPLRKKPRPTHPGSLPGQQNKVTYLGAAASVNRVVGRTHTFA